MSLIRNSAFCTTRTPFSLGYDPDALDALVQERMSAQQRALSPKILLDDGPATQEEKDNFDYIKDSKGGTSAEYLTARIARDNPTVLADMQAGKYPSVTYQKRRC